MALALLPRDATRDARLGEVERDLTELERLIEDVLAMARLDVSGFPARLGEVDVRTMLSELAEGRPGGHDPLVTITAARVGGGPPLRVIADEALLRRALGISWRTPPSTRAAPVVLGGEIDASGCVL
jgi:signal transduction histidine kinase